MSSSVGTQEGHAETNEELYQRFTISSSQLYRHDKGWHSSLSPMVGTMVADACFTARPSDIVVATLPKSGTTWIKALPVCSSDHPFNSLGPHECIKFFEYQLYTENKIPDLNELPDPRLFATHAPFVSLPRSVLASGCKIVYVCRDPKDTLVSHWSFVNKFRIREGLEPLSVEAVAGFFCDGVMPFGPYWDHVLGYWRAHLAHPEQVLFFRYEEMSRDPEAHARRLAEFVGRPFSPEEDGAVDAIVKLCSFDHMIGLQATKSGKMHAVIGAVDNSWFFRRGVVADWQNHLSPETARRIDAITKDRFRGTGLLVSG